MNTQPMDKSERPALVGVVLAMVALIGLAAVVPDVSSLPAWGAMPSAGSTATTVSSTSGLSATAHTDSTPGGSGTTVVDPQGGVAAAATPGPATKTLPGGATSIFGDGRFLVAYYGTAETGALGVLGETRPEEMARRVRRAAAPFARRKQPIQIVFELIVSIADRHAGPGRDYSHDIPRAEVQKYIDAAHRHDALLLLDIQPGRSDFLTAAKRWAWALKDPYVGLALDPEWRMGKHGSRGSGSARSAPVRSTGCRPGCATWWRATSCRRSCSCCTSSAPT